MTYQVDPNLQRRQALAQAMMNRPSQPVKHWSQGLNQALSPIIGAMMSNRLQDQSNRERDSYNESLKSAMSAGSPDEYISALSQNPQTVNIANEFKQKQILDAMTGGMSSGQKPTSFMQNWDLFNQATPDEQQRMLQFKRSQPKI